jgi:hypothetical protein
MWAESTADILIRLGISLAALAPIIFVIEVIEWLATKQWPGWSVEDGLALVGIEQPLSSFDAVQFGLDILTDLPLALGIHLIGVCCFYVAVDIVDPIPRAS